MLPRVSWDGRGSGPTVAGACDGTDAPTLRGGPVWEAVDGWRGEGDAPSADMDAYSAEIDFLLRSRPAPKIDGAVLPPGRGGGGGGGGGDGALIGSEKKTLLLLFFLFSSFIIIINTYRSSRLRWSQVFSELNNVHETIVFLMMLGRHDIDQSQTRSVSLGTEQRKKCLICFKRRQFKADYAQA